MYWECGQVNIGDQNLASGYSEPCYNGRSYAWQCYRLVKLPVCTTATAHTFAFEFDLVMDLMAIFSNRQTEESTGEKTYDMTVYEIWKHAAWSKHAVKSWLYREHPVGWMLFAWYFFKHHLDTEKRLSTTTMRWLGKPQQKTNLLSVSIHSTILYH